MLKIKSNIDLDILKNYGFIFRSNILYKPSSKDKDLIDIFIDLDTREVNCSGILGRDEKLDCLYDLIIGRIIEKVEID